MSGPSLHATRAARSLGTVAWSISTSAPPGKGSSSARSWSGASGIRIRTRRFGWRGFAYAVSAGADLTWHPAPTLTLNATINPDFAQVEADQVVLNLTNQELLLPEKRPFFLDGADAFSTPIQLVYTRRIGRTPLTPLLETSEILYDRIQPTPVYGAAKLTGTLGRGWTFSALGALTGPNTVSIVNADGSTYPFPLDSTTAFGALRVTRAIGPRLRLGISATSVTRAESGYAPSWLAPSTQYPLSAPVGPSPSLQRCPDGSSSPIGARCTDDAYAGGLDFSGPLHPRTTACAVRSSARRSRMAPTARCSTAR